MYEKHNKANTATGLYQNSDTTTTQKPKPMRKAPSSYQKGGKNYIKANTDSERFYGGDEVRTENFTDTVPKGVIQILPEAGFDKNSPREKQRKFAEIHKAKEAAKKAAAAKKK